MPKENIIINIIVGFFTLAIGVILLTFPNTNFEEANTLLYVIMTGLAVIKFIQYFLTRRFSPKDYEHLFVAIACVLAATSGLVFNSEKTEMVLALTLIGWVAIVAIIKLIKIDYLMDQDNDLWYVFLIDFGLFILIGVLTSINLFYDVVVQTLMLGFFFAFFGFMEIAKPLINALIFKIVDKKVSKRKKNK